MWLVVLSAFVLYTSPAVAGSALAVFAGGATHASDPAKFWELCRRVLKATILVEFL